MTPNPDKELSPEVVEACVEAVHAHYDKSPAIIALEALRAALPLLEAEIRRDEREKTLKGFRMWVINYPETVKLVDEALGCNAEHGIDLNQERRSRCGN